MVQTLLHDDGPLMAWQLSYEHHMGVPQSLLSTVESDTPLIDEELWSLPIVRARTGLSRSTIYAYIANGMFPAQRRLGPRRVAWRASEVKAWISSRPSLQRG